MSKGGLRFGAWMVIGGMGLTGCASLEARLGGETGTAEASKNKGGDPRTQDRTRQAQTVTTATAEYHFSLAQAYSAEGNSDRAIEEYKLTLLFDESSALVYARLATEYVKKGMLSAAMEACKEALKRDEGYIDARLILAGLYSASRDSAKAIAEYDRVLRKDPKHEEAAVYKAQILIEDGKRKEGLEVLKHFTQVNKESVLGHYYLGRAHQQNNQFKEAVLAYRKTIELKPGFSQAALTLGYMYEEKGMNPQALEVYKPLYEDTQDLTAANRIATIYLKEEKYALAVPYLEAIQAQDPDDLNARVKLGLIQMETKNYGKAVAIFKAVLEKNPEADRIHYYLGSIYEETQQSPQALAELRLIKPESKLYGDATLHIAFLLKQAGQIEEAKLHIRGAIEKSPHNPTFYVFEASLEEESKNVPGALAILEKAVGVFPEDEKLRYYLGSLYDRSGDVDKGIAQMETLLKTNPENVDALNYLGYTWSVKGVRLNDAEKMLRRALALKPDNAFIQDSWGWHLFIRGKVKESIVELEKAVRIKPNETVILEHLGDAYARYNLREKALLQYKDAAKNAEDDETKRKIQMKFENLRRELANGDLPESLERVPAAAASEHPGH